MGKQRNHCIPKKWYRNGSNNNKRNCSFLVNILSRVDFTVILKMTGVKQSSYKGLGVVKLSVLQFRGEPYGHSSVISNLFYNELVKVLNKERINVRKCFWTLTKRTARHVGEEITKEVVIVP